MLFIPPLKLYDAGVLNEPLLDMIQWNVRTPEEVTGDIRSQVAANHVCSQKIIEMLEDEGLVKSERDGIYKRFYPIEMQLPKNATHLTRIQESILNEIIIKPSITVSELGKKIEINPRVINYHVKALVSAGLIRSTMPASS